MLREQSKIAVGVQKLQRRDVDAPLPDRLQLQLRLITGQGHASGRLFRIESARRSKAILEKTISQLCRGQTSSYAGEVGVAGVSQRRRGIERALHIGMSATEPMPADHKRPLAQQSRLTVNFAGLQQREEREWLDARAR